MTKAATAATDKPAICAGVILRGSCAIAGDAVLVVDAVGEVSVEDVADGTSLIESTTTDWEGVTVDRKAVVIVGVAVVLGLLDDVRGTLVATTVRAVLVGRTASRCPRHTLYADPAALSAMEQLE